MVHREGSKYEETKMYGVKSNKSQGRTQDRRNRSAVVEWTGPRLTVACTSLPSDFC